MEIVSRQLHVAQLKPPPSNSLDNKTLYTWTAGKKCDLFGTEQRRLFTSCVNDWFGSHISLLVGHINV